MGSSSTDLKAKYTEILRSNGIDDEISEVTISKPDLRGMHMASIIETAKIDFVTGREPLHLFLKKKLALPPSDLDVGFREVMVNEGIFLSKFVQEMVDFREQRKGGPDLSDLFPRVYYGDEDVIIQEDLTKRGFAVMPKEVKRNFEETKNVFEHVARMHAVSHVMIANAGGPEEFLKTHPYLSEMFKKPGVAGVMSQTFESTLKYCLSIIKLSNCEGKEEKYEMLEKYEGLLIEAFMETIDADPLLYSVNHGDFWSNNMMIDAELTNKKLILVDFQCARINSPSMDLARFLFFSSAPDVRKRWRELLQYYFDTLKDYVTAMEHPFPFKFEDFVQDFSRKGNMDFMMGLMLVMGFGAIENHDTEDSNGEDFGGDFMKLLVTWAENNPEKVSSIGDQMVEMIDDFLLFGKL